jgi:lysophospholipase L1-like esterase
LFTGDSIAKGYTSGSTITPNSFPKLFGNKTGLNVTNAANGGALFSSGYNAVEPIPTTIKNANLTGVDYLFIAGGTNDYGLGVPLDVFENTIKDLVSWLKANYTGEVIFITPINRVTPANTQMATLDQYRQVITKQAYLNGFNVINGAKFNFPSQSGEYANSVFGDGLHPSELGYQIYSKELQTTLL